MAPATGPKSPFGGQEPGHTEQVHFAGQAGARLRVGDDREEDYTGASTDDAQFDSSDPEKDEMIELEAVPYTRHDTHQEVEERLEKEEV